MSAQDVIDHIEGLLYYPDDEAEWSEADYLAAYEAPAPEGGE